MKEGQRESDSVEWGSTVTSRREIENQTWTSNSSTWNQHADYVSANGMMHYNQDYAIRGTFYRSSPDSFTSEGGYFGGSWTSSSDEEWLGRTVS